MDEKLQELIYETIKRLNTQISKTPTGDLRNLLCDANIIIQTLSSDVSDTLN